MSVYTDLTRSDIEQILADYRLGELQAFAGIAAGIENSNFFIDTQTGRYVLTIFERMRHEELPYFMRLMKHLAHGGVSCPDVLVRRDGSLLFEYAGKHGCIVSCLPGRTCDELNEVQLRSSGRALASLHLAGRDFTEQRQNPTGFAWLQATAQQVAAPMSARYGDQAVQLLQDELQWQQHAETEELPQGVIHGDLFVDNILFEGNDVSGIIDFYYAHDAPYVMDIAISLNAQAVVLGANDTRRMQAFLGGYEAIRPLQPEEKAALPLMLRRAALRFWVSRLYDALFPREGEMVQIKDPEEYRRKLLLHREAATE